MILATDEQYDSAPARHRLAAATLAARLADLDGAMTVLRQPTRLRT